MANVLNPVHIINRCSFTNKILLVALTFFLPVVTLSFFVYSDSRDPVEFAAKEQLGVKYIVPMKKLFLDAQKLRSEVVAGKDGQAEQNSVNSDLQEIIKADNDLGGLLGVGEGLGKLKKDLGALKGIKGDRRKSYDAYSAFISQIVTMVTLVADNSNLTLDPDMDSYYVMDSVSTKLPGLIEGINQADALLAGIIPNKTLTAEEKTELTVISGQIAAQLDGFTQNMDKACGANAPLKQRMAVTTGSIGEGSKTYLAALNDILGTKGIIDDSVKILDSGTHLQKVSSDEFDLLLPELDKLLATRIVNLNHHAIKEISISFALILLASYFFVGFYLAMRNNIHDLRQAAQRVADGDLAARIPVNSQGEIEEVAESFNDMMEHLSQTMAQILWSSDRVAATSGGLKATAERISSGAEMMASQVATFEVAGKEMSETSEGIANNCNIASEASLKTSQSANAGALIIDETIAGMKVIATKVQNTSITIKKLGDHSGQISEIIGTIEDIADQTNLLA